MTQARSSEYDRFGPWVGVVEHDEDVPRLFRAHHGDLAAATLVLKVPRNIARRDATPDMDLYDHLVVLGPADLVVLTREPGGDVSTRRVLREDVAAVRDSMRMLDGELVVRARDGAEVRIAYNGSSRPTIARLVDEIRAGWDRPAVQDPGGVLASWLARHTATPVDVALPQADVALVSDFLAAARARPELRPWAWHGRRVVVPAGGGPVGLVQRARHALTPMTLHGGVLAVDGASLEVLGRHRWLVRGQAPDLSSSRLVVRLGGLERADVAPHPDYRAVTRIDLVAGASSSAIAVPTDSAAALLLADHDARH